MQCPLCTIKPMGLPSLGWHVKSKHSFVLLDSMSKDTNWEAKVKLLVKGTPVSFLLSPPGCLFYKCPGCEHITVRESVASKHLIGCPIGKQRMTTYYNEYCEKKQTVAPVEKPNGKHEPKKPDAITLAICDPSTNKTILAENVALLAKNVALEAIIANLKNDKETDGEIVANHPKSFFIASTQGLTTGIHGVLNPVTSSFIPLSTVFSCKHTGQEAIIANISVATTVAARIVVPPPPDVGSSITLEMQEQRGRISASKVELERRLQRRKWLKPDSEWQQKEIEEATSAATRAWDHAREKGEIANQASAHLPSLIQLKKDNGASSTEVAVFVQDAEAKIAELVAEAASARVAASERDINVIRAKESVSEWIINEERRAEGRREQEEEDQKRKEEFPDEQDELTPTESSNSSNHTNIDHVDDEIELYGDCATKPSKIVRRKITTKCAGVARP